MSKPFQWLPPTSTQQLRALLNAASNEAHLEWHDEPSHGTTFFVVEPGDVVAEGGGGGVNDSHSCPPTCP